GCSCGLLLVAGGGLLASGRGGGETGRPALAWHDAVEVVIAEVGLAQDCRVVRGDRAGIAPVAVEAAFAAGCGCAANLEQQRAGLEYLLDHDLLALEGLDLGLGVLRRRGRACLRRLPY